MNQLTLSELQPLIIEWAKERNILFPENAPKQRLKLIEECGELASAILKNDIKLQKDAIGDIFVVLTNLGKQINSELIISNTAHKSDDTSEYLNALINTGFYKPKYVIDVRFLEVICNSLNLDLTECANIAWNEIKDRKGQTINGTFIKN